MQEFLKGLFMVLHFSLSTLMVFLMMIYVILLFKLIILFFTVSVSRYLICVNN